MVTDLFVRPLAPMLRVAMSDKQISGQLLDGHWIDVGTPERLYGLEGMLTGEKDWYQY